MARNRPSAPSLYRLGKDVRQAVREAQGKGWTLVQGRKHFQLIKGQARVDVPASASDWRTPANIRAQVRRAERQESA